MNKLLAFVFMARAPGLLGMTCNFSVLGASAVKLFTLVINSVSKIYKPGKEATIRGACIIKLFGCNFSVVSETSAFVQASKK
jgi:hypothetical protein